MFPSVGGLRQIGHQRIGQALDIPCLDQHSARAAELIDQALAGLEAEGTGRDADLVIQRGIPGDHMTVVDDQGTAGPHLQLHHVAEGIDEEAAAAGGLHHKQAAGAAKENLPDALLRDHMVLYAGIAGKKRASVQPVLLCADVEVPDTTGDRRRDADQGLVGGSGRLADKYALSGGNGASKGLEHSAEAAGIGVQLSFQTHVLHINHRAALQADRLVLRQRYLKQRIVAVAQNLISHNIASLSEIVLVALLTNPIDFESALRMDAAMQTRGALGQRARSLPPCHPSAA